MLIRMSRVILLALAGIILPISANAQTITTYDFNSLSVGDINGQDNWATENQGVNCCNKLYIASSSSYNGTNYADAVNGGPSRNLDIWRINDGNFSIPTFTGNEAYTYIQFDVTRGWWGHIFGLGYDADGDTKVLRDDVNELGVRLKVVANSSELRFIDVSGTITSATYSMNSSSDWYQFRVAMNLTANSGQGSASVYAKNLTAGETNFTTVSGLQNINMGLVPGATDARNPQNWNAMYMNIESDPADFDNLVVFTGSIPTLTEWAAIILGSLLAIGGGLFIWRRFA